MSTTRNGLSRRSLLKSGAGVAGLATVAGVIGTPLIAQSRSLKIGSYGGYFENSFKEHVYPAFTEATGIAVESVTQPNSTDWLVTMQQAAQAGTVPADLSLYARDTMIKASRIGELLKPLDLTNIPNAKNLDGYFVFEDTTGPIGVGAMSWFTAMVINPDEVETPASWTEFWDTSRFEQSLGIAKNYNAQFMDIIAATFFDARSKSAQWGGLVTWQKDFAGDEERSPASFLAVQPFYFFQLGGGLYVRGSAVAVFDIENDKYNVPVGLGIGKVVPTKKAVFNLFIESQYTILSRGAGQPELQILIGVNTQFVKK